MKKGTLPLRWVSSPGPFDSSDDRAFDRQAKGPGLDTHQSGSVPFFTKNLVEFRSIKKDFLKKFYWLKICFIIQLKLN